VVDVERRRAMVTKAVGSARWIFNWVVALLDE